MEKKKRTKIYILDWFLFSFCPFFPRKCASICLWSAHKWAKSALRQCTRYEAKYTIENPSKGEKQEPRIMTSERKSSRRSSLFVLYNRILYVFYIHKHFTLSLSLSLCLFHWLFSVDIDVKIVRLHYVQNEHIVCDYSYSSFAGSPLSFEWACEEGYVWPYWWCVCLSFLVFGRVRALLR